MRHFICCYICVGCLLMYPERIFSEPNLEDKLIQYYDAYDKHKISHFSFVSIRGINMPTFNLIDKVKIHSDFLVLSIKQSSSVTPIFWKWFGEQRGDCYCGAHPSSLLTLAIACHHLLPAGLEYLCLGLVIWW